MSTKLQFFVFDLQIFPPTNTMQRAQTQRDTDERLLFLFKHVKESHVPYLLDQLQVLAVFTWQALSLFLEHRVQQSGEEATLAGVELKCIECQSTS